MISRPNANLAYGSATTKLGAKIIAEVTVRDGAMYGHFRSFCRTMKEGKPGQYPSYETLRLWTVGERLSALKARARVARELELSNEQMLSNGYAATVAAAIKGNSKSLHQLAETWGFNYWTLHRLTKRPDSTTMRAIRVCDYLGLEFSEAFDAPEEM